MTNMVYCIPKDTIPAMDAEFDSKTSIPKEKRKSVETLEYKDTDGNKWRIMRIVNGFILTYAGNQQHRLNRFPIEHKGEILELRNTNCIFFNTTDFEVFYELREVIKSSSTENVWEFVRQTIEDRIHVNDTLLESEI